MIYYLLLKNISVHFYSKLCLKFLLQYKSLGNYYFKNIFKVLLHYNQIGLLYNARHLCLLAILIVNYRSLRNLHKQENQYTSLVDMLHRILFAEK